MSQELAALSRLDRSLVHVFVAGPGMGEGVAIALPDKGWIVLDSCRTAGDPGQDLPVLSIIDRWQTSPDDDPVEWMLLTHPHDDHADGFGEVLDRLNPNRVGITGQSPPSASLLSEIRRKTRLDRLTEDTIRSGRILTAR